MGIEQINVVTREFKQYCQERVIRKLVAVEGEDGQFNLTGLNLEHSQAYVVVDGTHGEERKWRNLGYLRNFVDKTGAISFIVRLHKNPNEQSQSINTVNHQ